MININEGSSEFLTAPEEELKLMKDAHKVLIKKVEEEQKIRNDLDRHPNETLKDFIHYTTVKQMIDDLVTPVLRSIPALKKDMSTI